MAVYKFQNIESPNTPLEFSCGLPVTPKIKSYVLRHGLCYNLPQPLVDHIMSLEYPIYKNEEDPNYPGQGITRSVITGMTNRFSLIPVDPAKHTVFEHERDKLNMKVSSAGLEEGKVPGDASMEAVIKELRAENRELSKKVESLISKIEGDSEPGEQPQKKILTTAKK